MSARCVFYVALRDPSYRVVRRGKMMSVSAIAARCAGPKRTKGGYRRICLAVNNSNGLA